MNDSSAGAPNTTGPAATPTRVLLFAIGSLGDSVMAVPVLHWALGQYGQTAHVTVLHDDQGDGRVQPPELLRAVHPSLSAIAYPYRGPRLRRAVARVQLLRRLRRQRFDVVVNATTGVRATAAMRRDARFFAACGIRTRMGFAPPAAGVAHEAEMRLSRLGSTTAAADIAVPLWATPAPVAADVAAWRAAAGIGPAATLVAICPGSHMPSKAWPAERFAHVGRELQAAYDCMLVFVGGPAEAELCAHLAAECGGVSVAGRLSALGTAELMRQCALLLTVDTGTMHLAAAQGTPTVALFSQRLPTERWAPLGSGHRLLSVPVPCAGCDAVECPLAEHPCMRGISAAAVLAAAHHTAAERGVPTRSTATSATTAASDAAARAAR